MLDRVVMNVIHAAFKIGIIPNLMLPKPPLPNARFASRHPRRAQPRVVPDFWQGFAAQLLDHVPTQAEIGVIFGQCPNGVQVVGQQHPSINRERMMASGARHRLAQRCPKCRLEQNGLPLMRDHREKKRAARGIGAAIIRHGSSIRFWDVRACDISAHRFPAILSRSPVGCALERTANNPTTNNHTAPHLEHTPKTSNFHMFPRFQDRQSPASPIQVHP